MKYNLGNLKLCNRVFLAPMLEPNDIAFRLLCKKMGCGLTFTGMVSPLSKQKLDLDDKPVLQLFGNSGRGIKSFMKKYDSLVSGWDFNLGCPSKLSKKFGHGACLGDLGEIRKILRVMRENTVKPVTVKIRKSDKAFDILKIAEEVGLDGIAIHARTLAQGYSGEVDYEFALELKKKSGIPVIFSGVSDLDDVDKILRDFDFVMIGRKAIGNPNVFRGVSGYGGVGVLEGLSESCQKKLFGEYLGLAKSHGLYFRQIKYQAMNFTKGVKGGKEMRMRLIGAKSLGDIEEIFGLVSNKK